MDCVMFVVSLVSRYLLYYALAVGFLVAVAIATGYWMGGLIGGLIPTMFASLMCGVAHARRTGRRASAEVAWGAGALFALVSAVCGAALFVLLASDEVTGALMEVGMASPFGLLVIVLISLLVTIVASRIFFGLGSRTSHGPASA
jgi:hypothetical protein